MSGEGGEEADVIVLGAGFAGLACAVKLSDAGLRCVVLEARDRPGGRAQSLNDGVGGVAEAGAEFIHGEKVATWRYLQRFGLTGDARGCSKTPGASVLEDGGNYVFADGVLHPPELVNGQPNRLFFDAVAEATSRWQAAAQGAAGPEVSIAQLLKEREADVFARMPPTDDERRLCHGMMAEWYGADLAEVSIYEDCPSQELLEAARVEPSLLASDGEEAHWRVAEGYSQLASRMAEGLDVRYGHVVDSVAWLGGASELAPECGAGGADACGVTVSARAADAVHTFRGARAVVALPLACLQQGDVDFAPPLPEEKQESIREIGAGTVAKVMMRFESAFWPRDMQFLFTPFSVQIWWPASRSEPWLTGYLGGATDLKLLDKSDEEVVAEALRQLRTIFAASVPELPPLASSRIVGWHQDRWSKMGYSFARLGASPSARLRLRAPSGPLLWAGEAAHPTKSASVHGALESGEHAARQALESLYSFVDLREGDHELMDRVHAELLQPHFPVPGELDDVEDMRRGLLAGGGRDPELHVLVARRGASLAACACYEYYPGGNFVLISYVCVAAPFRRHGLARSLLRRVQAAGEARAGGRELVAVFAETHAAGVEDGVMDPAARQEVLASLGFRCLRFSYTQPPLSDHHEPCGGLRLLVRDKESLPPEAIVSYLDEFAGSVFGWDGSWKQEPYYTAQLAELQTLTSVEAIAARPW